MAAEYRKFNFGILKNSLALCVNRSLKQFGLCYLQIDSSDTVNGANGYTRQLGRFFYIITHFVFIFFYIFIQRYATRLSEHFWVNFYDWIPVDECKLVSTKKFFEIYKFGNFGESISDYKRILAISVGIRVAVPLCAIYQTDITNLCVRFYFWLASISVACRPVNC